MKKLELELELESLRIRTYFKFQAEWVLIYWASNFRISAGRFLITRFLYAGFYFTINFFETLTRHQMSHRI